METIFDYGGFASYLAYRDRRRTTIRKHTNCLKYLSTRLPGLTALDVINLLTNLKSEGKSGAYLNMFVNALRLYGDFKEIEELKHLKAFKKVSGIKATLSDDEVDAFLSLPKRKGEPEVHYHLYKMFWELVADTGCRPGEVARLRVGDIDWGRGVIIIEISKTNTPGVVPIPPNHKEHLVEYLKTLKGDFLFAAARGHSSYTDGYLPVVDNVDWHFDWKRRLKILGLTRPHLTPYSFRHSYATRLLEEDISLFHVKKLMRHNDLKSTLVYEHLTTKDLIKAQAKLPRIQKGTQPEAILQRWGEVIKNFHVEEDSRFSYEYQEDGKSLVFTCRISN